jgi:GT2 family glycosyltransferase
MIGVLNVLYENHPGEVQQYYRKLEERFSEEGPEYRIFALDNSAVSQRALVPRHAAYRHFPENIGYTRACNLLMEQAFAAGCDRILATNLDGFLLPGCLTGLLATLDRHHGAVLAEARQFPFEHPKPYDPRTGATNWASGCCILITRETVEKLGPLDEQMFLYAEDVDYSFRAKLRDIPSVTCPEALFFHRYNPFARDDRRLRHQLIAGRYFSTKWRSDALRGYMEDTLLSEGFFASRAEMPALPVGLRTYPCPIDLQPSFKRSYAPRRWDP